MTGMNPTYFIPQIIGLLYILLSILHILYGQEATTQCYPELGCFDNNYPWSSLKRPLPPPQDPKRVGTKIYCYTRDSPQRFNISLWPDIAVNDCPINGSRRFVFITHGYTQNGNLSWLSMTKDSYLLEVDANVFLVDWGPGAAGINYLQVSSNTRIVGAEIARFLRFLQKTYGLTSDQVHMIGHSLGAHICAYSSNDFGKVDWITGLDAAQPAFEGEDTRVRLDKGDANFVDLIHTSAKLFIPTLGFGYIKPNGHVDIYINGGADQPGCPLKNYVPIEIKGLGDLVYFPIEEIANGIFCDHVRAYLVYLYAIHNCTMLARQTTFSFIKQITSATLPHLVTVGSDENCTPQTCTTVGLKTRTNPARGVFGANTTSSPPFCGSPGDTSFDL